MMRVALLLSLLGSSLAFQPLLLSSLATRRAGRAPSLTSLHMNDYLSQISSKSGGSPPPPSWGGGGGGGGRGESVLLIGGTRFSGAYLWKGECFCLPVVLNVGGQILGGQLAKTAMRGI